MIRALLLALCLALPVQANTWVFESLPGSPPTFAFLQLDGTPYGHGWLYIGESAYRVTGYGYLFQGWWLQREGWLTCLVIDPSNPWISGTITWRDGAGFIDILSADGQKGEIAVKATLYSEAW
jgi:hypothetical protein